MKIALIGYGKMGQEVASVVKDGGVHEIVSVSFDNNRVLDLSGIKKADVAIDFTTAAAVLNNISEVAALGTNIVVGTTGWYEKLPQVKKIVEKNNIGLIFGQNFSIGANIFFQITDFASSLFNKFGGYDVYGLEVHHSAKKDSPSGTAKKLSDIAQKHNVSVPFTSIRAGRNPGFHEITFDSPADQIKLSHQAHGRRGFAAGAIMAAQFIKGKKGIHTFDEIFKGNL